MDERPPDLEQPEEVLAYCSDAIIAVRDALDHGVSLADTKLNDMPFDPYLWAHMARRGACLHFENNPQTNWERGRILPNSGIEICRMPLTLRVLKSFNNNTPHPGFSIAKKNYYTEAEPRLPLRWNNILIPTQPNFVLDWAVDESRQLALALSKPLSPWKFGKNPKIEWRQRIVLEDVDHGLKFETAAECGEILAKDVIDQVETDTWQES